MIALNTPHLEGNEKKYLLDVIESKWLARGPYNEKFEKAFSSFCGVKYGLSVTSGTVAVQVLLMAAGMQGKKVAVPAYTCMSVAQAVVHSGAIPVFVDVEFDTFGIRLESLEAMYKKYKFSAVLLNHMYGFIAKETFAIKDWCERNKVMLLEDASEAHGATKGSRIAGSIGEAAAFSMRSEKMIGVGEGGMVVTDNEEIYNRAYYFINDSRPSNSVRYWTTGQGYNFFMPNALGAIGLAQVEQIDTIIRKKRKVASLYRKAFSGKRLLYLSPMQDDEDDSGPVYWLNVALMTIDNGIIREDLISMMHDKGVEMRPGFYPLNKLPAYTFYPSDKTPTAWSLGERALAFPSNVYMDKSSVDTVMEIYDEVMGI